MAQVILLSVIVILLLMIVYDKEPFGGNLGLYSPYGLGGCVNTCYACGPGATQRRLALNTRETGDLKYGGTYGDITADYYGTELAGDGVTKDGYFAPLMNEFGAEKTRESLF